MNHAGVNIKKSLLVANRWPVIAKASASLRRWMNFPYDLRRGIQRRVGLKRLGHEFFLYDKAGETPFWQRIVGMMKQPHFNRYDTVLEKPSHRLYVQIHGGRRRPGYLLFPQGQRGLHPLQSRRLGPRLHKVRRHPYDGNHPCPLGIGPRSHRGVIAKGKGKQHPLLFRSKPPPPAVAKQGGHGGLHKRHGGKIGYLPARR